MQLTVQPRIIVPKLYLIRAGIPLTVGVAHPAFPWARVFPTDLSFVGPVPASPAAIAWAAARGVNTANFLNDDDADGLSLFEEYAMGLTPQYPDNLYPNVTENFVTNQIQLQHSRNLLDTGITHTVLVGDGFSFAPGVEGVDYEVTDIDGIPGHKERVLDYGPNSIQRVDRVLRAQPGQLLRLQLSGEV